MTSRHLARGEGGGEVGAQVGGGNAGGLCHLLNTSGGHAASGPAKDRRMRNPNLAADCDGSDAGLFEIVRERHAVIVQSLHSGRQAECAVIAKTASPRMALNVQMRKMHPIRPFLRKWREHFDKSQEWVANETGTSHSSVSRAEAGKTGVDEATFEAIARAYGISVAELSADPAEAVRARELGRLLALARELDDGKLKRLADLAEDLLPEK